MGLFDSEKTIETQVTANMAYEKSKYNAESTRDLENRLEKLEEYLGVEWSESNGKYYKSTPIKQKKGEEK